MSDELSPEVEARLVAAANDSADNRVAWLRLVEEDSLDEKRLRIRGIEANALEHAERLALRILDNPAWVGDVHASKLAIVVAEQTRLVHSLRNALLIEVSG